MMQSIIPYCNNNNDSSYRLAMKYQVIIGNLNDGVKALEVVDLVSNYGKVSF